MVSIYICSHAIKRNCLFNPYENNSTITNTPDHKYSSYDKRMLNLSYLSSFASEPSKLFCFNMETQRKKELKEAPSCLTLLCPAKPSCPATFIHWKQVGHVTPQYYRTCTVLGSRSKWKRYLIQRLIFQYCCMAYSKSWRVLLQSSSSLLFAYKLKHLLYVMCLVSSIYIIINFTRGKACCLPFGCPKHNC